MTVDVSSRVQIVDGVLKCQVDNEIVALNRPNSHYVVLNETSTTLWLGFEAGLTVGEVVDSMTARYDVSTDQCLDEIRTFVTRMVDLGLMTVDGHTP